MHYTRDGFSAFRASRKAIRYSMNSSGPEHKSFTRTSNITSARLAERDWCIKIQSSLLQIYFRLSGFQSSILLIYFREGSIRCSHCTKVRQKKTIRYVTRLFRDLRDAASLAVTEITLLQPFLCVNRSPVQYDFHGGTKASRYCVNIA